MTSAERALQRTVADMLKRAAERGVRSPLVRGRHLEANVNVTQLTSRQGANGQQLRILAAGNGAATEDIGKFWFVVGYSKLGGPDIVPTS